MYLVIKKRSYYNVAIFTCQHQRKSMKCNVPVGQAVQRLPAPIVACRM